ncbi:MAG TPA: DUF6093 family protein [Phytomonospora sp.]
MTDRDFRGQIEAAMARLTAARADQLLDSCIATGPAAETSTPVLDDDGMPVAGAGTPVYTGACAVSDPTSGQRSRTGTVVDDSGVPYARILKLPLESPELQPGDVVQLTDSPLSPGLVGDVFVVVAEIERSYATCRKYGVRGSSWRSSSP